MDSSEADNFAEVASKPLRSLPYDTPGQTFVAFEKPEGITAVGKFSNTLRFIVKEVHFPALFSTMHAFAFSKLLCMKRFWNLTWLICYFDVLNWFELFVLTDNEVISFR